MNLGLPELVVIVIFALLIIGPERLPKAGRAIGRAIRQFRDVQGKLDDTLKSGGIDPQGVRQIAENPFLALEQLEKLDTTGASSVSGVSNAPAAAAVPEAQDDSDDASGGGAGER